MRGFKQAGFDLPRRTIAATRGWSGCAGAPRYGSGGAPARDLTPEELAEIILAADHQRGVNRC